MESLPELVQNILKEAKTRSKSSENAPKPPSVDEINADLRRLAETEADWKYANDHDPRFVLHIPFKYLAKDRGGDSTMERPAFTWGPSKSRL